jgi:ketosteroid isomerase-like protein
MSDSDTISRQRTEFVSAFNSEQIEAMAALLADDSIAMAPNRPAIRGKDSSRQFWREGFAVASSQLAVVPDELQIVGDVAIDQFHWTMDSTPRAGGSPVHDEGKCIWVWRRQPDGSWKMSRAIWNSDLATAGLWSGAGMPR